MLQLWFYQIAVKHTNHAPSFVPSLTVCTVPCGAVARRVCMFAHGGSVISQTGLCRCWQKTRGFVRETMCHDPFYFAVTDWISNAELPCVNITTKWNTSGVGLLLLSVKHAQFQL